MIYAMPEVLDCAYFTHRAMGTIMSHRFFGNHLVECQSAIQSEIEILEHLLSRFIPESDICRINQSSGIQAERIAPETVDILIQALNFSRLSAGCFDITIGPLVSLWRNCHSTLQPPAPQAISRILDLISHNDLVVDSSAGSATLIRHGQSIDLGGIGKGYAADRMMEIYREFGIISAFSNLGGNVIALGTKPDGSPWRIGIQHPRNANRLIGSVRVKDRAVVTSGDYQRFFTDNKGNRYHHILDPRTGYPVESGLTSVTVISSSALSADALSTILFVTGMDKGQEYLRNFPGTDAIFVDEESNIVITPGLDGYFLPNFGMTYSVIKNMDGKNE